MKVCEVGLFNTCLALLKALIEVSLKMNPRERRGANDTTNMWTLYVT